MTIVFVKALQDVAVVIDALMVACGSTEELAEARLLVRTLLEELKLGNVELPAVISVLRRVRELLAEARYKLEDNGCLDAYRVDDAIAALDSVIGPLDGY